MILYKCDLCDQPRECTQKEIERTEYDICAECWNALESKLHGKGRRRKNKDAVLLPSPILPEPQPQARPSFPGQPPEIIADGRPLN